MKKSPLKIANIGDSQALLLGMLIGTTILENQLSVSFKAEYAYTLPASNSTSNVYSTEMSTYVH